MVLNLIGSDDSPHIKIGQFFIDNEVLHALSAHIKRLAKTSKINRGAHKKYPREFLRVEFEYFITQAQLHNSGIVMRVL